MGLDGKEALCCTFPQVYSCYLVWSWDHSLISEAELLLLLFFFKELLLVLEKAPEV